jgi:hypothetical protein
MTLQLIHSEFPYSVYEENLFFFFISVAARTGFRGLLLNIFPF